MSQIANFVPSEIRDIKNLQVTLDGLLSKSGGTVTGTIISSVPNGTAMLRSGLGPSIAPTNSYSGEQDLTISGYNRMFLAGPRLVFAYSQANSTIEATSGLQIDPGYYFGARAGALSLQTTNANTEVFAAGVSLDTTLRGYDGTKGVVFAATANQTANLLTFTKPTSTGTVRKSGFISSGYVDNTDASRNGAIQFGYPVNGVDSYYLQMYQGTFQIPERLLFINDSHVALLDTQMAGGWADSKATQINRVAASQFIFNRNTNGPIGRYGISANTTHLTNAYYYEAPAPDPTARLQVDGKVVISRKVANDTADDWALQVDGRVILHAYSNDSLSDSFADIRFDTIPVGNGKFTSNLTIGSTNNLNYAELVPNTSYFISAGSGGIRSFSKQGGHRFYTGNDIVPYFRRLTIEDDGIHIGYSQPASIFFEQGSSTGTSRRAAEIKTVWSDSTDATRTSQLILSTVSNGSTVEALRVRPDGLRFGNSSFSLEDNSGQSVFRGLNYLAWADGTNATFIQFGAGSGSPSALIQGNGGGPLPRLGLNATTVHLFGTGYNAAAPPDPSARLQVDGKTVINGDLYCANGIVLRYGGANNVLDFGAATGMVKARDNIYFFAGDTSPLYLYADGNAQFNGTLYGPAGMAMSAGGANNYLNLGNASGVIQARDGFSVFTGNNAYRTLNVSANGSVFLGDGAFSNIDIAKVTVLNFEFYSNASARVPFAVAGALNQSAPLQAFHQFSSTGDLRIAGALDFRWLDGTDATRKSEAVISTIWSGDSHDIARFSYGGVNINVNVIASNNIFVGQGVYANGDVVSSSNISALTGFYAGDGGLPSSAIGAFNSTSKGFLPPRMTTAQRNAIVTTEPIQVINSDTGQPNFYVPGTGWMQPSMIPA